MPSSTILKHLLNNKGNFTGFTRKIPSRSLQCMILEPCIGIRLEVRMQGCETTPKYRKRVHDVRFLHQYAPRSSVGNPIGYTNWSPSYSEMNYAPLSSNAGSLIGTRFLMQDH